MLRMLRSPATRYLTWVALVVSVLLWIFVLPYGPPSPYRLDFDVYRTGGGVFLEGGTLYGGLPELAMGIHLPFTYPPIAAVLFSAFAIIPLWLGSLLFTIVSIGALWWIARLVERRTPVASLLPDEIGARDVTLLMMIAFTIGMWFGPVRETFWLGQINIVLTALVLADVSVRRPRWWTGALVGLAIAIKLTPAVFLLFFFLRADWRSMLRTLLSFLLFSGIGHLLMPSESRQYWTEVVIDTGRIGGAAYASNQSINGALARFGLEGSTLTLAWFVLSLIAGLTIAWIAWRLLRHGHLIVAAIVVGFAALLCSPVSWGHHWIWAWPLLFVMALWALKSGDRCWAWLSVTGALIVLTTPQWWWPHAKWVELQWTWYQHLTGDAMLLWSLVALMLLGVRAARTPSGNTV